MWALNAGGRKKLQFLTSISLYLINIEDSVGMSPYRITVCIVLMLCYFNFYSFFFVKLFNTTAHPFSTSRTTLNVIVEKNIL